MTIAPLTDKHWTSMLKAVGHPEWFEGDEPRTERVKNAARKLIDYFPRNLGLLARTDRGG